MNKKSANPALFDKLGDIGGRVDAVYAMLDVIRDECVTDNRICDAIFGVECFVKSITESLNAFEAELEKAVAV